MSYFNIREEELKNKVANDIFFQFDCTKIIGNIDFCATLHGKNESIFKDESLLWAEAKKNSADLYNAISQLILTIGKARTFDTHLPPPFLGAFDAEKIAFVPYSEIADIFYQNDFNWNVTASDYSTREFLLIRSKVENILNNHLYIFYYEKDEKALGRFIRQNLIEGKHGVTKLKIDKNNFMVVYNRWLQEVKGTILVNWDKAKKGGIIDGDFYLADLLSQDNITLKEKLYVILKESKYILGREINEMGLFTASEVSFNDNQVAHTQFWNKYERPPKEEYWDYIVERRDLLVPQDIRERKGSFFTPQIWVELSQKYLADTFGENWQDEYYIWDCAAGTGNLLAGLTNKYNIWASTLDQQDVDVMHDRIKNGANLLESHVFQFDFLNDEFTKLPEELKKIINDPKKRQKLIIYINPPYAEATSARKVTGTSDNKAGVSKVSKLKEIYNPIIGNATNELFALFMVRIYKEIPDSKLAQFSTLKFIQGSNFVKFRNLFNAEYLKGFVVPAKTFDNVLGQFPIGFTIWNLKKKNIIDTINCEVFLNKNTKIGQKQFYGKINSYINSWLLHLNNQNHGNKIGMLSTRGNDFQNQKYIYLATNIDNKVHDTKVFTTSTNFRNVCNYFAVRHCIPSTWLNDRDQFLFPNDGWESDTEFQNDCLAFTLFHGQNRISSSEGANHWIPFTEREVDAKEKFESNFMCDYIAGKIKPEKSDDLFSQQKEAQKLEFTPEAKAVFDAGRELWRYYHTQKFAAGIYNPNVSLYDIREHFQGRNDAGKMNNKSKDEEYNKLIDSLRASIKTLAEKLKPKIYEYGFLRR